MKVIILGAGGRGNTYARYCHENGIEIAAAADLNRKKLLDFGARYGIDPANLYGDWKEALQKEKFADAVINATPDKVHYESSIAALEKNYHLLLEKPISPSEQECIELVQRANDKKLVFMVCHVLRYAPFFEKIKEIVDSGAIGEIINFQLTENVANWHFAHSYVRGIFRNERISAPWILAKSCHDLDIVTYITGKRCLSVVSEGELTHFREENAPENAPAFCLDGCPHERECPYFAPKLYLKGINYVGWPATTVSVDTSFAARYRELQTGDYGRCVYRCGNDIPDHQSAIFRMEGGMTATFNMIGLSSENTRILRIYGTKGDLQGHLDRNEILLSHFNTGETKKVEFETVETLISSHGGGDFRLIRDFIKAITDNQTSTKASGLQSLQGHLMGFAAEKARKTGRRIEIDLPKL